MHSFEEPSTQHSTTSSIMEGLNPSQVEAVTQPMSASTCVMAGPGSGKTKVLTCRIAYLLEQDRRNRILAVTFTRKASGEMQKRVEKLLSQQQSVEDDLLMYPPGMNQNDGMVYPPGFHQQQEEHNQIVEETVGSSPKGLERVTLGTFHSVCAKILRYNGNLLATLPSVINDMTNPEAPINLDGSFVIADQSDQLRILKECFDEAEIDLKKSGIKPLVILNAIGSIKESLSQGIDPFKSNDRRKPIPKSMRLAKDVYGSYREKLFSNNAVDFDDLILLTREMLQENKELRQRLHQRWGHILVDEFQDTSRSQMDLIKLLTSSSLFVVGDADQSIYSWRGAHAGSMSDFAMEFKNYGDNGVVTVYLKENYR
jgi:DNA helicase-2/ATP-dependent DNA helicase PcrA